MLTFFLDRLFSNLFKMIKAGIIMTRKVIGPRTLETRGVTLTGHLTVPVADGHLHERLDPSVVR